MAKLIYSFCQPEWRVWTSEMLLHVSPEIIEIDKLRMLRGGPLSWKLGPRYRELEEYVRDYCEVDVEIFYGECHVFHYEPQKRHELLATSEDASLGWRRCRDIAVEADAHVPFKGVVMMFRREHERILTKLHFSDVLQDWKLDYFQ